MYTTCWLPLEYMQGVDYSVLSILGLTQAGAVGPCLYMAGGTLATCISLPPKFLPNASGGRNEEGLCEGGVAATAVPAAAVQKQH